MQKKTVTVLAPASFRELEEMLEQAVLHTRGPVAVRYPRGGQGRYTAGWNRRDEAVLREGNDVTVVSYGVLINEALDAADRAAEQGISPEVIKLNTLAPLMAEPVVESVRKTRRLVVVEDCVATGSIGQQLCAALAQAGVAPETVRLCNTGDRFIPHGSVAELRRSLGIDSGGIFQTITEVCHGKSQT